MLSRMISAKRSTHTVARAKTRYYVTARIDGGTGNARTSWLCGPFLTLTAAMRMVPAVTRAAQRTGDPRMAFAAFGVTKYRGDNPPPGRLDYSLIDAWDLIGRERSTLFYT